MKVFLMHPEQDFEPKQALPLNHQDLIQDLELETLFDAMALGDKFLDEVIRVAILCGSRDLDTIRYRQEILKDCLENAEVIRQIYHLPVDATERKRRDWLGIYSRYPSSILNSSVGLLQMYVGQLKELKAIVYEHGEKFKSEGLRRFCAMIEEELDDAYFESVENHLMELKFRNGVLLSAELGQGNEAVNYLLRKANNNHQSWIERVFIQKGPEYSFTISDRDHHGARALGDIKDMGINLVANALAQSADHVDSFFMLLRVELAFYMGCINLYEQLNQIDGKIAFPEPVAQSARKHTYQGLYDVCLALTMKKKVVGNDGRADGKDLIIITGANQGGKSTFLRAIGVAQVMMQAGLYVGADSFSANLCDQIFTHYKRKEDTSMKSGKFDEELSRMSAIVDLLTPKSLVLFNESFAATNEREGSEIARQITRALLNKGIKVIFVSHLYEFARSLYDMQLENSLFLRAERKTGGKRTFKLIVGEPLETSYGPDLYKKIFTAPQQAQKT